MVTGDFSPANCTKALLKVILAELSKVLPGATGLKELISSYDEMEQSGKIDAISNALYEHGKLLTSIADSNNVTNEDEFVEIIRCNLIKATAMDKKNEESSGNIVVDYLRTIDGFEYKEVLFSCLAILSQQYSDIRSNIMNLALDDELEKDFRAIFENCNRENKFVKTPNVLMYFYEKETSIFRAAVEKYFSGVESYELVCFLKELIADQGMAILPVTTYHDLEIVKVAKKFAFYSSSHAVTERHVLLAIFDDSSVYRSLTVDIMREKFGDKIDVILPYLKYVGRISTNNSRFARRK